MRNKIHSIAIIFVGLLFSVAVGLLFSVAAAKVSADASAEIEQEKSNIVSLINDGNYAQAQEQTQKLLADFPKDSELPKALYEIADKYRWATKYEQVKSLYQQIMQNYPDSPYANKAKLGVSRVGVLSLIISQNYDQAAKDFDKLLADFAGHPDLPETFYWVAERYQWAAKYEQSKNLYAQTTEKYSDSPWAGRAELGIDRTTVLSFIELQQYDRAKEALDKLVADFSGHPDLPETLYWIARKYGWLERYDDEKSAYQQLIKNCPDSPYAEKARLGASRANVLSLIMSQDYDGAKDALDKMVADFPKHPDLHDSLYWIARKYGWAERHEEEKAVYQQIMEKCPDSPYVEKAALGAARANIQSLILSKDYEGAKKAVDKIVVDFANNPYLHDALYWIAERYTWEGRFDDSKTLYQQIIQNYPDSPFSSKARTGLSKVNALSLVMSQDPNQAGEALEKIVDDFNDNPNLLKDILRIALETRYKQACSRQQKEGTNEQVKEGFRNAKSIAETIEKIFPDSAADLPESHLYIAYCDYQLGENAEAAESCQKMISDWPDYEYIHYAQLLIASSYEKLAESGVISASEADYQIEQALAAVIEKETKIDRESIARALLELGRWYVKMGEKDLAVNVYEELIMRMDDTNNTDALAVKAELEKLR